MTDELVCARVVTAWRGIAGVVDEHVLTKVNDESVCARVNCVYMHEWLTWKIWCGHRAYVGVSKCVPITDMMIIKIMMNLLKTFNTSHIYFPYNYEKLKLQNFYSILIMGKYNSLYIS